ncbi:(2Fe-2S) ferredoxin domain-containing protein [Beijerinckia mobilis]|uniref:(2Fe-2S) ferredoxin domain-containing protein n=1 Tax=Beijerinckia mobilis TaxID=231434 RepID=UPI000552C75E|nr:(2Fe-2S) ferredoxin domain-containing protein [Beijerinckia mobilis]
MALKDIFGRPAEARRLIICVGPCCNKSGEAEAFVEELRQAMQSEQIDEQMIGTASCMRRACLGKCTGEPLAFVHPDEVYYHHLSPAHLLRILREHLLGHRPVSELILPDDGD